VIANVDASSDAAQKGVRKDDILVRAGDRDVNAATDLSAVVDAAKKAGRQSVLVGIYRGGRTIFLPLKVSG
jgi:serine protease Do